MTELLPYVILDISVIVAVVLFSLRFLSLFHPLLHYILFHLYSISSRSWELLAGRYPMYFRMENARYYSAIRPEEFINAIILADVALVLFFLGSVWAHSRAVPARELSPYNDGLLKQLILVLLPITFALLITRRAGGVDVAKIVSGFQLLNLMSIWPIALISLAMARWGARWYLVLGAIVYLGLVATQGYHRVQTILPILLLIGVFTARQRRRWPRLAFLPLLIFAMIVFPGLKQFGKDFQKQGFSVAVANFNSYQSTTDVRYTSASEMFMDQYAGALTTADQTGTVLWGKTYLALVTLPVPRAWWPDKPSVGVASIAVSAAGRPYKDEGRIVTTIGESYLNFRIPGVIVVFILLSWGLTSYYIRAFSVAELDPYKVAYIGIMASLFQTYRDGLSSLILFSVGAMGPLYLYLLLNSFFLRAHATALTRAGALRARAGA